MLVNRVRFVHGDEIDGVGNEILWMMMVADDDYDE